VGIAALGLGLVIDASPGPTASGATVRIVEPFAGDEVPAGRPIDIRVEVENGSIARSPADATGGHLHLYVNGVVQRMPYATETRITLAPGLHELRIEYVDSRHVSFSPEVSTTIEVEAV
jgi:hypothetical protein